LVRHQKNELWKRKLRFEHSQTLSISRFVGMYVANAVGYWVRWRQRACSRVPVLRRRRAKAAAPQLLMRDGVTAAVSKRNDVDTCRARRLSVACASERFELICCAPPLPAQQPRDREIDEPCKRGVGRAACDESIDAGA